MPLTPPPARSGGGSRALEACAACMTAVQRRSVRLLLSCVLKNVVRRLRVRRPPS